MATKRALLRVLGLGFGVAILVGGTVGVGIMRTSGETAGRLVEPWLIYTVWAGMGLFVLIAANTLAELATAIPQAGGPYVYVHRAFGDYLGFVSGWGDLSIQVLASGFLAIAAAEFLAELWPGLAGHAKPLAAALLFLFSGLHTIGVRASSASQQLLSVAKVLMLAALVYAAFAHPGLAAAAPATGLGAVALPAAGFVAIVVSMQTVLEVYGGYDSSCYFTEETTDQGRTVPRALFAGVLVVIVIYLAVNAALLHLMSPAELGHSRLAAADALERAYGPAARRFVAVVALVATLGVLNSTLLLSSRILLALGRDGHFVSSSTRVSDSGVPVAGLWYCTAGSLVVALVGGFNTAYTAAAFLNACNVLLCGLALFVLRRREPSLERPFRALGYPLLPALGVAASAVLLVVFVLGNTWPSLLAIGCVAGGYPVFLQARRHRARASSSIK